MHRISLLFFLIVPQISFSEEMKLAPSPTIISGQLNPFKLLANGQALIEIKDKVSNLKINGEAVDIGKNSIQTFYTQTEKDELEVEYVLKGEEVSVQKKFPLISKVDITENKLYLETEKTDQILFDNEVLLLNESKAFVVLPSEKKWFEKTHNLNLINKDDKTERWYLFDLKKLNLTSSIHHFYLSYCEAIIGNNEKAVCISYSYLTDTHWIRGVFLNAQPLKTGDSGALGYSLTFRNGYQISRRGLKATTQSLFEGGFLAGYSIGERYDYRPYHQYSAKYSAISLSLYMATEPFYVFKDYKFRFEFQVGPRFNTDLHNANFMFGFSKNLVF